MSLGLSSTIVMRSFRELVRGFSNPCLVFTGDRAVLVAGAAGWRLLVDGGDGSPNALTEQELRRLIDQSTGDLAVFEARPDGLPAIDTRNVTRLVTSHVVLHWKDTLSLIFILAASALLLLGLPYFTRAVVDRGIGHRDFSIVVLIIAGQLALVAGRMTIEAVRAWMTLHIGVRLNDLILAPLVNKVLSLPYAFFHFRTVGDISQRFFDSQRLQTFVNVNAMNALFSIMTLAVFSCVLIGYDVKVFLLYAVATTLGVFWTTFLEGRRRALSERRFALSAEHQTAVVETVTGALDLRVHCAEASAFQRWTAINRRLARLGEEHLRLQQLQRIIGSSLNELRNVGITLLAAYEVIHGRMTLGTMMAINYITGQLSSQAEQLVGFVDTVHDARVTLDRVNEIHAEESDAVGARIVPPFKEHLIVFDHVSYRYSGGAYAVRDASFSIPPGRATAITGATGSGKTTLLKILLKLVEPTEGEVRLGDLSLADVDTILWRNRCGVVLQDGAVFAGTIAHNVAMSMEGPVDETMVDQALRMACLDDFVKSLPQGMHTQVGSDGVRLSGGQRQRLLIARAMFRTPALLILDEAASALDEVTERAVLKRLLGGDEKRTVVLVTHRLSTLKYVDHVIDIDDGRIMAA